ncbi:hypothetical protein [Kineosporia babensis]|uniref:Uncharacterized protein n=1 Tax=Kineosporia babensis TaxID=499548 RepID=A0A9X1NE33_9ACTN|nr:hypothetical protein [Kineosporia babensis]MCD5311373.1 hypothetical protein [Kineosporia babensis]
MSHDELEHRLQALLHERQLDLTPRSGATGMVEGRVRRARRRRRAVQTMAPAALTVVAIAAGMAIAGQYSDDDPVAPKYDVLSDTGLGEVQLGIPITDAQAAGVVGDEIPPETERANACLQYQGFGSVERVFADRGVIVQIDVDALAETPQGLNIGDTYGDVVAIYPEAGPVKSKVPELLEIAAPGGSGNVYRVALEPEGDERDAKPAEERYVFELSLRTPDLGDAGACQV